MKVKDRAEEQLLKKSAEMHQRIALSEEADAQRQRAEEALKESERRYRLLAENVTDVIWTMDMNLHFTYISPSVTRQRGYSVEEAMAQTLLEETLTPASREVAMEALAEELAAEGKGQSDPNRSRKLELELSCKGGSTVWAEIEMTFLRDSDDRPVGILGVARDISERKGAQEALRKAYGELEMRVKERTAELTRANESLHAEIVERQRAEEEIKMLSAVAEQSTEGMAIAGLDGNLTFINKAWCRMHGYKSPKELLGKSLAIFHNKEQIENDVKPFNEKVIELGAHSGEVGHITRDGKPFPTLMATTLLKDKPGKPYALAGIAKDITERKRMEEALRESGEKYRRLLGDINDGYLVVQDEKVIMANERAAEIYGVPLDEFIGSPLGSSFPADVQQQLRERFRRRIAGEAEPERYELTTATGIAVEVNGKLIDYEGRPAVAAVVRDITERQRAEETLRQAEQEKTAILSSMSELVALQDAEMRILWANRAVSEATGVPLDQLLGRFCYEVRYQRSEPCDGCPVARARETGRPEEGEVATPDGRAWLIRGYPILDASGNIKSIAKVGEDFTERKRAGEAMRDREQELQAIFDSVTDGIVVLDLNGRVVKVNRGLSHIGGYAPKDIVGQRFDTLKMIPPESMAKMVSAFIESMSGERVPAYEVEAYAKSGEKRYVEIRGSRLRKAGKTAGVAVVIQDITERREWEGQLKGAFRELQKTLGETVEALAQISEAKDPYTAGHQRGVAQLAIAIAKEMGFEEEQLEGIRVAGMLHDIGKIHVPAEILSKPGRLSEPEFNMIKAHAQLGHDILKVIEFRWPIAQMVLQHHERMNGSGYPFGLSGEEIILEARILAVADVVDAMTHHRPYRPARGIDKAIEEISKNSGVLYDVDVADACLKLLDGQGRQLYEAGDLAGPLQGREAFVLQQKDAGRRRR